MSATAREWLPIESAPKDGTEILLWCDHCNSLFLALWACANHNCYDGCCEEAGGDDTPRWRDAFGLNDLEDNWHKPSLWQSAPEPPKETPND